MSSVFKHTAHLPFGFTAEFSWEPGNEMRVEWEPDVPRIRSPRHRRRFFEAYVAARREFMTDVATSMGGNLAVVDWAGDGMPITLEVVEPVSRIERPRCRGRMPWSLAKEALAPRIRRQICGACRNADWLWK